ncbi:hypothetical protein RRG08_021871 [Elysia crispata]|uniref:Uncharacterized protein n=1 Tax=Elysia crispata TaxID=231223 RepID=A0AAE0YFW6_9GAST|nr:hypothetical protein RRG08_021871 [Elysia crispata]
MDGGESFLLGGFSRAGGNQTDRSEYVVTKRKKPSISLLYERNREFGYPMEGTKYILSDTLPAAMLRSKAVVLNLVAGCLCNRSQTSEKIFFNLLTSQVAFVTCRNLEEEVEQKYSQGRSRTGQVVCTEVNLRLRVICFVCRLHLSFFMKLPAGRRKVLTNHSSGMARYHDSLLKSQ